jgi:DNA-binding transcriptional ArsR family regulator
VLLEFEIVFLSHLPEYTNLRFPSQSDDSMIEGRLTLPPYQRPYRWSTAQVAELAEDLDRHFKEAAGHDYYLGSLILHRSADGCLNIIDGQQRITSMGILGLLAKVKPLPQLGYAALESQQRIIGNIRALDQHPPPLTWLTRDALERINVTLVITDSEDDAYRFFETQNSGGVRLSGIDIAKSHHLRAIPVEQQDTYARIWETMGDLQPVVDVAMRGRFWQKLDWRVLASASRQPRPWRDQVVGELAQATSEEGTDLMYHLAVTAGIPSTDASAARRYDLRQPLDAGCNTVHYLEQFQNLLLRYCPKQLADQEREHCIWRKLYVDLVAQSEASDHLRKLYDAALVSYLSRFGDTGLHEAGLWLFRAVYSLRLANDKMVKEASVQRFVHDTPLLDWIHHSYTHIQLVSRLRKLECKVSSENLDLLTGKKRKHITAVCRALGFWQTGITVTPALIVERFDSTLCQAIEQYLKLQDLSA